MNNKSNKIISINQGSKYVPIDNNLIHFIRLNSSSVILENGNGDYRDIIHYDNLRQELDNHIFGRKIIVTKRFDMEINIEMVLILINYFAGKKYRLTRPIGHGNEQITFIKQ